ncbi:unnamed protein product, partial [Meganyctiphanes norvegica]
EIEGSDEPGQIEDDEIKVKEELEIKEEPIDFTAGNNHCSQYDQKFPQINTHMKNQIVYTGNKPYQCNQCDKAFSHRSSFIIHQILHTGRKPYQCSQCDKAFSRKSGLINH